MMKSKSSFKWQFKCPNNATKTVLYSDGYSAETGLLKKKYSIFSTACLKHQTFL